MELDIMEVNSNHNDHSSMTSDANAVSLIFPALDYPLNLMVPVEITKFLDGDRAVIRPAPFGDHCVKSQLELAVEQLDKWQRQKTNYCNMLENLQRAAPHLPQCEMVDNGIWILFKKFQQVTLN